MMTSPYKDNSNPCLHSSAQGWEGFNPNWQRREGAKVRGRASGKSQTPTVLLFALNLAHCLEMKQKGKAHVVENQHLAGQCTCSPIPTTSALSLSSGSQSPSPMEALNPLSPCTNIPLLAYEPISSLPLKIRTLNALPSLAFYPLFHMFWPPGNHCTIVAPCPPSSPCSASQALSVVPGTPVGTPIPYSLLRPFLSTWLQRRIIHSEPLYFSAMYLTLSPLCSGFWHCHLQETALI